MISSGRNVVFILALGALLSGCQPGTAPVAPPSPASNPSEAPSGAAGVKLWLQTGRTGTVTSLAFSPKGKLLASAGDTVRIWNSDTGQFIRELPANGPAVTVAFSPDGRTMALAGSFVQEGGSTELLLGQLNLIDTTTWTPRKTLIVPDGGVACIAFSPDGSKVAASRARGSVTAWDATSGQSLWVRNLGWSAPTDSIAWSPDGRLLAVSSRDHTVKLVDSATGKWVNVLKDDKMVRTACFTPDGKTVISAGDSGQLVFWDASSGKKIRSLEVGYPVNQLALNPKGDVLATIGTPGLTLWDPVAGKKLQDLPPLQGRGLAVAFSPDGTLLARGGLEYGGSQDVGGIRLLQVPSGTVKAVVAGAQNGPNINLLAFSPDQKYVASAANDTQSGVYLWDLTSAKLQGPLQPGNQAGSFQSLAFAPPTLGATLPSEAIQWVAPFTQAAVPVPFSPPATASAVTAAGVLTVNQALHAVELKDVKTSAVLKTFPLKDAAVVPAMAVSADGKRLAVAQNNDPKGAPLRVTLFDVAAGGAGREIDYTHSKSLNTNRLNALALSADGSVLAVGSIGESTITFRRHGTIDLWKTADASLMSSMDGRGGSITSLAFAPDGHDLASCGHGDSRIKLWDTSTGKLRTQMVTNLDVVAVAFSPTGQCVGGALIDGTWRLFNHSDNTLRATFALLPPAAAGGSTPEWIVYTPTGYYEASPGADKYIFWLKGNDLLPASQYSTQFHRPDLVTQVLHF